VLLLLLLLVLLVAARAALAMHLNCCLLLSAELLSHNPVVHVLVS
jgi:hypothetical protein